MIKNEFVQMLKPTLGKVFLFLLLSAISFFLGFVCATISDPGGFVCGYTLYSIFSKPLIMAKRNLLFAVIPLALIYLVSCIALYAFRRNKKQ